MAWGVTMMDGTPVLGNIELKGRALILAVTSAERAARGSALIADTLADLVGTPLTTIETIEQAMAARQEGLTASESAPDIDPQVATPLVHAMLDQQYRATLDEPVGMLGDITPRAATRTKAGRERLSAWLKHLENRSGNQQDPNDPPIPSEVIMPAAGFGAGKGQLCFGRRHHCRNGRVGRRRAVLVVCRQVDRCRSAAAMGRTA